MQSINLFIGLSQNQVNAYQTLINKKIACGCNVLISSSSLNINHTLWNEKHLTAFSFNNNASNSANALKNIYSKILIYKDLIKKIEKYKKAKNLNIYFTYIEDILTNYLVLSFNNNSKGYAVEDGTLNYYHHTIKSLNQKKVYLKYLFANLLGIPFKLYKGHSSGIEYKHVLHQYVRLPELSMFPNKSKKLPYQNKYINATNSILIIGQEAYINQYGAKRYYKALQKLLNIISDNHQLSGIHKIYYKPHRNGSRVDYSKLKFRNTRFNPVVLDPNEPLEELFFEKLKSKFIYGFDSTALINLNLELDQKCKDQFIFHALLEYNDSLEKLFHKFNILIFK